MNTEIEMNKEARTEAKPETGTEAWAHEVIALANRNPSTPEEAETFLDEFWATLMGTDR